MSTILAKRELVPKIFEYTVSAPRIAEKAKPGQFVIVMADDSGERIPLTIADFDRSAKTITMVLFVVGISSWKLAQLEVGEELHALLGPLGLPSEIEPLDTVVLVAGGVGTAPIYPIARGYKEAGCRVVTIQGARTKDLLFWTERLAAVSDQHLLMTDDGTAGCQGLVTAPLQQLLEQDTARRIGCVYAIGPPIMMKSCAQVTRPRGVKTVVSLNTIMIDGTGMCGGCRVEVGGQTQFTCVDGPEFDGHQIDWDLFLSRQRTYHAHERCALDQMAGSAAS
jgi:ferredoxin/flavodoxin---NADP+ reductase